MTTISGGAVLQIDSGGTTGTLTGDVSITASGNLVFNRADVPEDRREEADAFVAANGGMVGHKPLFEVIGGKTPASVPGEAAFYALPPAALVAS